MAVQDLDKLNERMKKIVNGDPAAANPPSPGRGTGFGATSLPQPEKAMARAQSAEGNGFVPKNSNVVDIATDMMGDDSRLMRAAATAGLQFGNRRGLLNSSITAGAMQDASLQAVSDFSKQEAAQRHEYNMQERRGGIEMDLAQLDADTRKELLDREAAMRESLQSAELDSNAREQMSSMATKMFEHYERSKQSILSNPDLPASERKALLAASGEMLQHQINMTKSIFQMDFDWAGGAFNPSTGTPSSGGGGGGSGGGNSGGGVTKAPAPSTDPGAPWWEKEGRDTPYGSHPYGR